MPADDISRRSFVARAAAGHRRWTRPWRWPTALSARLREMPDVRSVFVNGGVQLAGANGGAPRDADGQPYVRKDERDAARSASSKRGSPDAGTTCPDIRFCRPQRQRPARRAADRHRAAIRTWSSRRRAKLRARDGDDARPSTTRSRPRRSTGRRSASCRIRRVAAELGVSTDAHRRDGAGRHHRRLRREPRQVQRRRAADADPRAAAGQRARATAA